MKQLNSNPGGNEATHKTNRRFAATSVDLARRSEVFATCIMQIAACIMQNIGFQTQRTVSGMGLPSGRNI
eukprot:8911660-Karenia_brevis.AAC.1